MCIFSPINFTGVHSGWHFVQYIEHLSPLLLTLNHSLSLFFQSRTIVRLCVCMRIAYTHLNNIQTFLNMIIFT